MNKEEIKFYSIGRGSLNLDGKFYYGLDYAITDFMRNLEQENKELKEQLENASNNYTKYIQERDNKIDKAIEYLETNGYGYDCCGDMCYFLDEDNLKDLLEILKDSDVNE